MHSAVSDPRSVEVNLTAGSGMEILWKDGHKSHYSFLWLRDACPCALCDEERSKTGRKFGQAPQPPAGTLPMYRTPPRATEAKAVGRYAISFVWNDGHQHGIYSWDFLRKHCPCAQCASAKTPHEPRAQQSQESV